MCTQVTFSKSEELFYSTVVHGGIFIIPADSCSWFNSLPNAEPCFLCIYICWYLNYRWFYYPRWFCSRNGLLPGWLFLMAADFFSERPIRVGGLLLAISPFLWMFRWCSFKIIPIVGWMFKLGAHTKGPALETSHSQNVPLSKRPTLKTSHH